MNSKLPLYLLVFVIFFSSCKKDLIGFKSKKKENVHVEEIDFDYFQTKTKVRYAEGDKQVNGNASIRIKRRAKNNLKIKNITKYWLAINLILYIKIT